MSIPSNCTACLLGCLTRLPYSQDSTQVALLQLHETLSHGHLCGGGSSCKCCRCAKRLYWIGLGVVVIKATSSSRCFSDAVVVELYLWNVCQLGQKLTSAGCCTSTQTTTNNLLAVGHQHHILCCFCWWSHLGIRTKDTVCSWRVSQSAIGRQQCAPLQWASNVH